MERPTTGRAVVPWSFGVPTAGPRLRRRVRLVLFAWAAVGVLLMVATLQLHLTSDPLADVHAYYDAAARLNAGQPLYAQAATTNEAAFYRYPPLLAIAFRPLALLPFAAAAAVWEVVVLASFVLTLRALGLRRSDVWIAAAILGLPIGWAVAIGQAQVPVTLLLAIGSPFAVAFAAQLKIFPALAAVFWIGRRDRRSLARFVIASLVLVAIQVVLEPRGSIDFLATFGLDQVGEVRNLSPYALSPVLWAALVVVGVLVALRLAPTRWGWAASVTLSVLATPRLLTYMLMTLVAALRRVDDQPEPGRP